LAELDFRLSKYNQHASAAYDEMHERVLKSQQVCRESRELMANVDLILEQGRKSANEVGCGEQ
jgi:hypothetical protein